MNYWKLSQKSLSFSSEEMKCFCTRAGISTSLPDLTVRLACNFCVVNISVAMLSTGYRCCVVSCERSDTSQSRTLNKPTKYNMTKYGKVLKLALCNQYSNVPDLCLIRVLPKRTSNLFFFEDLWLLLGKNTSRSSVLWIVKSKRVRETLCCMDST